MRIDLAAPPFSGHLHPILGIARLLAQDHEVRVLTMPSAMPSVSAAGLNGIPVLSGWESQLTAVIDTPKAVRSNPFRMYGQLTQALKIQQQLRLELETLYENERPALLIADFTLIAAGHLADARGITWWTSMPSPCVLEVGDGPPAYVGGLTPQPGLLGHVRDRLGAASIRCFKLVLGAMIQKRLRKIGVESIYRPDGSESAYSNTKILALGSPAIEFRHRWPAYVRWLPFPLYTPPLPVAPPPFVSGRRHILVTLGTHLKFAKDDVARSVHQLATQLRDCEFHFSDGDVTRTGLVTEGNFTRLAFVDYQRHMSRYALVVHHGGAGIMHHTLNAGLPAVVYPIDYDQFDHAARLQYAGLAIRIGHLRELYPAVQRALSDAIMHKRCDAYAGSDREDCGSALRGEINKLQSAKGPAIES
jgi:UDP:flavonoid glycosyltransferase YjiC (YdhE family)